MSINNFKTLLDNARNLCDNNNPDYCKAVCDLTALIMYGSLDYSYYIAHKIGIYKIVSTN